MRKTVALETEKQKNQKTSINEFYSMQQTEETNNIDDDEWKKKLISKNGLKNYI